MVQKMIMVCDRCGDEYAFSSSPKVEVAGVWPVSVDFNGHWSDTARDVDRKIDLCPKCGKAFAHWFQFQDVDPERAIGKMIEKPNDMSPSQVA